MKRIAIIPARKGSVRLPNKNKLLLAGKPLISWTIEAALSSKSLDEIIVTSNDGDIINIATKYNNITIVDRPDSLSTSRSTSLEVINHALSARQDLKSRDLIVTLQPTSPIRSAFDIDNSINMMTDYSDADSLVSVTKTKHYATSEKLFTVAKDNTIIPVSFSGSPSPRQTYSRNGASIYITRFKNISKYVFGGKILAYEMPSLRSIDIDTSEDFLMAEAIMTNPKVLEYAIGC